MNGVLTHGWLNLGALTPVAELDGTGAVRTRFVYATRPNVPDYLIRGDSTYRLVLDHLGSVRLVVNTQSGSVAQRIDYDEWGRETLNTAPGWQPFGYAGGLSDPATGLVRFGARDYDPATGRWTAKDPLGFGAGDGNLYVYSENTPVDVGDPNGLTPWGVIFAGVDIGMQLYEANGRFECLDWGRVGLALLGGGALNAFGKGAFFFKRGSHTWGATRQWMNRMGIQLLPKGGKFHRHHWLFERNQGLGRFVPDWLKNQPWNTNPIPASFNNWLGRNPELAWLGAPSWAAEVLGGATLSLGASGDD